jgi:hypothetical protein
MAHAYYYCLKRSAKIRAVDLNASDAMLYVHPVIECWLSLPIFKLFLAL